MTKAVTEKYEELIVDVEFVAGSSVYTPICGLIDATINRSANLDEDEVPDCDDETLPLSIDVAVRSIVVDVSGTGKWAQSSQGKLKDWFYSGQPLNARVRDTAASTGDTEVESGPALLTTFNTSKTKGKGVDAEIAFRFVGTPARTDA
jgi:hypothetical protein